MIRKFITIFRERFCHEPKSYIIRMNSEGLLELRKGKRKIFIKKMVCFPPQLKGRKTRLILEYGELLHLDRNTVAVKMNGVRVVSHLFYNNVDRQWEEYEL